jgi:histidinol-phosphate aminotransferase
MMPFEAIEQAGTGRRIVFLTNPHNPSGLSANPLRFCQLAARVAPALVFIDEAYADFSGESVLDELDLEMVPNLLVGRTFAKTQGLAGIRIGALAACRDVVASLRALVPPYSVNVVAAAVLPAALADLEYRDHYVAESAASRYLLHEFCVSQGFRAWGDAANFVLIEARGRAADLVEGLAVRGIAVRDRSTAAGSEGCIRVTAGYIDDTRRAIAAMTEVLCGGRR